MKPDVFKYSEFSCSPAKVDQTIDSVSNIRGNAYLKTIDECAQFCDNTKKCNTCSEYNICNYFTWDENEKNCVLTHKLPEKMSSSPGTSLYTMDDCTVVARNANGK